MFRKRHIHLGHFAGIPIDVHLGCLLFVPLGILVVALEPLAAYAEWSPLRRWLLAGAAVCLMAISVFLHDVGHLVAAKAEKLAIQRVVFYPFGGVYRLGSIPIASTKMIRMTLAGPMVSLLLAGLCWGGWWIWGEIHVLWLAQFNLLLVVLNVLPTPPLDGGHLLWLLPDYATSPQGGTPIAFLAITMLMLGLVLPGGTAVLFGLLLLNPASVIGGLLLLLTGWLVIEAPTQVVHICTPVQQKWLEQTAVAQVLSEPYPAAETMLNHLPRLAKASIISAVVPSRHNELKAHLPFRTLEPWVVHPSTSLLQALHKLDASRGSRLLVVVNGRVVDTITREQIFAPFKQEENLLQLKADSFILLQPNKLERTRMG